MKLYIFIYPNIQRTYRDIRYEFRPRELPNTVFRFVFLNFERSFVWKCSNNI